MKAIIYIFLITVISESCGRKIFGGVDDKLGIMNKSSVPVYAYYQVSYPDTSIGIYQPNLDIYKVLPGKKINISMRASWERVFADQIPSGKLMIFIYDAQTLETVPWDTIRKNYMILKRYDLTLHDLDSLNWTITYP